MQGSGGRMEVGPKKPKVKAVRVAWCCHRLHHWGEGSEATSHAAQGSGLRAGGVCPPEKGTRTS